MHNKLHLLLVYRGPEPYPASVSHFLAQALYNCGIEEMQMISFKQTGYVNTQPTPAVAKTSFQGPK